MKGKTITRICRLLPATLIAAMLTACDAHIEETDMTVRPGHILCEDGSTVPYEMYDKTREKAIAVVFDTDTHDGHKGIGYAVYLWDLRNRRLQTVWVSNKEHLPIQMPMTAMPIHLPSTTQRRLPLPWQNPCLTCGDTDRVPLSLQ